MNYAELTINDKSAHEENCGYKLVECDKECGCEIPIKDFESHKCFKTLKNLAINNETKTQSLCYDLCKAKCDIYKAQYKNIGHGCNNCKEIEFFGVSYICKNCDDFDLCSSCYKTINHPHKMNKIVPIALYTEVIDVKRYEYTKDRARIYVIVLVKNFEDRDCIINFCHFAGSLIEYIENDFFSIKKNQEVKKVLEFSILKTYNNRVKFYINEMDCERFFGLPFDVNINQ